MKFLYIFIILFGGNSLFLSSHVQSARIVVFHGIASYSHRVQTWPLAVALSQRGHEVSYISPFYPKEPNPNISEVVPQRMADYVEEFLNEEFDINLRIANKMDKMVDVIWEFAYDTCANLFESSEFLEWMKNNTHTKIDLFIIDNCLAECGVGVASKFGAKHILFSTVAPIAFDYDLMGFLPQSSAVPELEIKPDLVPFGFFERVTNTLTSLHWRLRHYFYSWKIDHLLREKLQMPEMPYIEDAVRNTSLIFVTGDAITDYPRALPPLYVNVAGTHCRESTKALPKHIEDFVSSNKTGEQNDGFIYISLGSLVVSSNLPDNIKQIFFDVIKSYPNLRFLWKWNGDFPTNIPKNLMLQKWYPQIDVLGHPKIRGFVTQSGRPSTLEALYLGVPMISFPILGDQDMNANRLNEVGANIKLEIGTFTFEDLHSAVEKVAYDPSVKAKITELQRIFRDRPMTPVETAVWYVEFALRTDTSYLKPPGSDQYWFVRRQLDVWAFICAIIILITVGTIKLTSNLFLNAQPESNLNKLKHN